MFVPAQSLENNLTSTNVPENRPVALDKRPKIVDCPDRTFAHNVRQEIVQNSPARRNIVRGNVAKLRLKFDGFASNEIKTDIKDPKRLEQSCPKPITPSRSTKKVKTRNAKKGGFDPKQSLILHHYRGQGAPEGGTGAN